jgi:hypothetical protein
MSDDGSNHEDLVVVNTPKVKLEPEELKSVLSLEVRLHDLYNKIRRAKGQLDILQADYYDLQTIRQRNLVELNKKYNVDLPVSAIDPVTGEISTKQTTNQSAVPVFPEHKH